MTVGLARRNPPLSLHFTAGPVVASGVVVVVGGGGGGGGGGHSRVGGFAAAAAGSAVNLVAAVGVVGDDSCSVSPLYIAATVTVVTDGDDDGRLYIYSSILRSRADSLRRGFCRM